MRTFIICLAFIFGCTFGEAAWYIIDTETNRAVGITQYKPDEEDLASRNEIAISSDEDVLVEEAEYVNGKIKVRMKSQEEKNKKEEADEEEAEMAIVYHRMFTDTYKLLKAEGKTFKHMHKHIDPDDL